MAKKITPVAQDETSADESSLVDGQPTEDTTTSAGDTPVDETPKDETPVDETPVDETSKDDTPTGDTSKDDTDTSGDGDGEVTPTPATHVTVYCNLPSGLSFRLPDGRKLTFHGYPVAQLVGTDGRALLAGRYGKTNNVRVEDWEYIAKTYQDCAYFSAANPLVFAADTETAGDVRARGLGEKVHSGLEQIDVYAPGVRTKPAEA